MIKSSILLLVACLAMMAQTVVINGPGSGGGGSVTAGPSGAISVASGAVDVVPSIVPLLANNNTFTGTQTFGNLTINGVCSGSGCAAGGSGISTGTLAAIPSTCSVGASYIANNVANVTGQLFFCTAANTWTQFISAGTSGAIAITNGVIDVVPGVLPQLNLGNAFTGSNSFAGTTTVNNLAINGTCTGTGCNKGRTCEIHIWGSGASSALQTADSENNSCYNDTANTFTITSVKCLADNSSTTTTVLPVVAPSTAILTGALTCGNGTFASGTLSGTPTIATAGSINATISAAGTAKSIRLIVTGTY